MRELPQLSFDKYPWERKWRVPTKLPGVLNCHAGASEFGGRDRPEPNASVLIQVCGRHAAWLAPADGGNVFAAEGV